jgi:DNA invertase Pin-like site-specific DNA recombinase
VGTATLRLDYQEERVAGKRRTGPKRPKPVVRDEKLVVAYYRVSSREQAEGYGLDFQERLCKELAEREGLRIVASFKEIHSAKQQGRPELKKLGEFIAKQQNVGGILAHKLDRTMRNFKDAAWLFEDLKLTPWFVDQRFPNNAQGRFALSIFIANAKYYSENLSDMVKEGHKQKAIAGGTPFKAPHGYIHVGQVGDTPILDPKRIEGLRQLFEDATTGDFTLGTV